MKVHIIGLMPDGMMHVHTEGCADVTRRAIYRQPWLGFERKYAYAVESLRDVVMEVYGPQAGSFFEENGMTEDDWETYSGEFKIFPCLNLPHGEGKQS